MNPKQCNALQAVENIAITCFQIAMEVVHEIQDKLGKNEVTIWKTYDKIHENYNINSPQ